MKGKPKKVGVTASGAVAAKGTIAADPAVYPFGTRIGIPGYGLGIVQDIGGSIKGAHIDIWFPSHEEASAWGARKLKVKVENSKENSKGSSGSRRSELSIRGFPRPAPSSKIPQSPRSYGR